MEESHAGSHTEVIRPSDQDRCAECGRAVGGEWISYRQSPNDPQGLIEHFGGTVRTGPAESQGESAKASVRDFRYPDDLGVFFHATCAPRVRLSEKMRRDIAAILADALVADTERNPEKYTSRGPAGDTQVELEPQATTIQKAETTMDETVNLDWQRFSKLTEARSRFAKTSCVYIQADSRACPIRVGKASEGLEARYRDGTGYAIDVAMHESGNLVFVAGVERDLCGCVEAELIWQGRQCLRYNNKGKIIAPSRRVSLSHSGTPPTLNEFETGATGG